MDLEMARATIRKSDLFAGMDDDTVGIVLGYATERGFETDEVVFRRGELAGNSFLLVVSGHMNVLHDDGQLIRSLGSGEVIGEIGTISPKRKRTRDVVAADHTEVLEWNLLDIEEKVPDLLARLKELAWQRISDWPD